jgi:DNA-binding PadR family transcriptional regulator
MSLRHTILGFLSMQPLSGYDLKRYFDASVRHFWSADQAAIYRTLNELTHHGLVEQERVAQETRPDRKVYHVTVAGLAELDGWLSEPAPTVHRREPLLVKLFFSFRLDPDAWRAVVEAELQSVEAELASFRDIVAAIEQDATPQDPATLLGPLITLSNGVETGLAYRDWLRRLLTQHRRKSLSAARMLASLKRRLAVKGDAAER